MIADKQVRSCFLYFSLVLQRIRRMEVIMQKRPLFLMCLALFLSAPQLISPGWTQTDPFYKGKTIRIMVGSTAGGFTTAGHVSSRDTWASISRVSRRSL